MFGKWELVEENKPMVCESFDTLFCIVEHHIVYVDVYRKKKWNGIYKYKNVRRS